MKEITEALKFELRKTHSGINTKPLSWDCIYDTEQPRRRRRREIIINVRAN